MANLVLSFDHPHNHSFLQLQIIALSTMTLIKELHFKRPSYYIKGLSYKRHREPDLFVQPTDNTTF